MRYSVLFSLSTVIVLKEYDQDESPEPLFTPSVGKIKPLPHAKHEFTSQTHPIVILIILITPWERTMVPKCPCSFASSQFWSPCSSRWAALCTNYSPPHKQIIWTIKYFFLMTSQKHQVPLLEQPLLFFSSQHSHPAPKMRRSAEHLEIWFSQFYTCIIFITVNDTLLIVLPKATANNKSDNKRANKFFSFLFFFSFFLSLLLLSFFFCESSPSTYHHNPIA